MKTKILILCALTTLGFGCKKESVQVDRYRVFSGSWEETVTFKQPDSGLFSSSVTQKCLVKVDTATGRVWSWNYLITGTNRQGGWVEMADSGYVLPAALQNKNH